MTLHADVTSVLLGFFDVFLIELCTNLIRFDLVCGCGQFLELMPEGSLSIQ
jgi:hypothetical protein